MGLALLAAGCRPQAAPPAKPAAQAPLTVFYTCDTRGNLYPCDCATGQDGGIARRALYLRTAPAVRNRLLVDAGNTAAGGREWERLELDYLLKAYAQMGYDAVNVGEREASLGLPALRELRERGAGFISANLTDASGSLVFDPYVVVMFEDGLKVGVIGVLETDPAAGPPGPGLDLIPAEAAIGLHLESLKARADVIVLLAFAPEETLRRLAEVYYEIPVLIGGDVKQPTAQPLQANKSLIVATTDKGKSVGRLDLEIRAGAPAAWSNEIVELTSRFGDDPGMVALLEGYEQALEARRLPPGRDLKDDAEGLSVIKARRETPGPEAEQEDGHAPDR